MATVVRFRNAKTPPAMEKKPLPKKPARKWRLWTAAAAFACFIPGIGAAIYCWAYVMPEMFEKQEYASQKTENVVVPLAPLQTNLSDGTGQYCLDLGMKVELRRDSVRELRRRKAQIRDALIMLMSGKSSSDIASPEGKAILKAEIRARINQMLGFDAVINVYLTDCLLTRR